MTLPPDRRTDPCGDFYQFACGGWTANHPIPADRSIWSRFDELQERNDDMLRQLLESAAAQPTAETRKIGDYYASCMDEPGIDAKGVRPLQSELDRIASLANRDGLPAVLAMLHSIGTPAFFGVGSAPDIDNADLNMAIVGAGGLGLPDRDYYFRDDATSTDCGKNTCSTSRRCSSSRDRRQIPTSARRQCACRDGHCQAARRRRPARSGECESQDVAGATAGVDASVRLARVNSRPSRAVVRHGQRDAAAVSEGARRVVVVDAHRRHRDYLRWKLLRANAPMLPTAFVNENFRFYGTTLSGTPQLRPRWKRCVEYTDGDLGEALGKAYVAKAFGPQAKANTLAMVAAIEAALREDVSTLTWMSDDTRKQARGKLRTVAHKIGYPDKWRDYGKLQIIRGDALGNSQRTNTFDFRRAIDKIGKRVDRTEWLMSPPTVNAYYQPTENNINFPAGILQPPFYYGGGDRPTNFGAAGSVVGHELTHGFDDQGRKIRRERQPARLVDGTGRQELRQPRTVPRRRIQRIHRRRRRARQREADAWREHRRQRRASPRPRGVSRHRGGPARSDDRRLHAGTAALHRMRTNLVRELASKRPGCACKRIPFAGPVPHERRGVERAGIREGVLVQSGRAHVARTRVGFGRPDGYGGCSGET